MLSVLAASAYITLAYQDNYEQIQALQASSNNKLNLAEQLFENAHIQMANFKDLLIQGKDSEKYYEYLQNYYAAERKTLLNLEALRTRGQHSQKVSEYITLSKQQLSNTAFALRKALSIFNSTDIDPEVAASEFVDNRDKLLLDNLNKLLDYIELDTQTSINNLQQSLQTNQRYTLIGVGVILLMLLLFFYRVLENKITRPIARMIAISGQFSQPEDSTAGTSNLDKMIDQLDVNTTQINRIMNSTGEAIYTVNMQGICSYANPACARELGFANLSDVIGKNMHETIHSKRLDGSRIEPEECQLVMANLNNKEINRDSEYFWHTDGHAIPVEYHSYPISDKGIPIGSVITFKDITQRRHTENELAQYRHHLEDLVAKRTTELSESRDEAVRANKSKDIFLSQMSHELRTPLNAIIGFSQLMQITPDEPLQPLQDEYVGHINNAGQLLLTLINQILDISHMSSGNFNIDLTRFNIQSVTEELKKMMYPLVDEKSITINDMLPENSLPDVYADKARTLQVLTNLFSNAIKYNHNNGQITLSYKLMPPSHLRIFVADTGIGIHSDDAERIFKPFERIKHKDFIEGSGIGLTICKNLIELMHGDIGFNSQPEQGTTFWIDLPLADGAETDPADG